MVRLLSLAALLMLLGGCPKRPSPAQAALQQYAEAGAKGHPLTDFTNGGRPPAWGISGDEPTAGAYEYCHEQLGEFDWVRTKPASDEEAADGMRRVELVVDICMRPENGQCNKPNEYALMALMQEQDGQWVVMGSTCKRVHMVRM